MLFGETEPFKSKIMRQVSYQIVTNELIGRYSININYLTSDKLFDRSRTIWIVQTKDWNQAKMNRFLGVFQEPELILLEPIYRITWTGTRIPWNMKLKFRFFESLKFEYFSCRWLKKIKNQLVYTFLKVDKKFQNFY